MAHLIPWRILVTLHSFTNWIKIYNENLNFNHSLKCNIRNISSKMNNKINNNSRELFLLTQVYFEIDSTSCLLLYGRHAFSHFSWFIIKMFPLHHFSVFGPLYMILPNPFSNYNTITHPTFISCFIICKDMQLIVTHVKKLKWA